MGTLARRPPFRTLLVASTISLVGDWMSFVALASLSIGTDDGFVGLAWVFAVHALPKVMLAPWAGLAADRFDKRTVMLVANVVQTVLTLGMALAAYHVDVGALRLLVFVRSAVSAFHTPAESASVPMLVEKHELTLANAFMSTSWGATLVLGMALGGLVAMLGPTYSMLLDAGTFALASALLAFLPRLPPDTVAPADARVARATREAFRVLADASHLLRAFLAKSSVSVPAGAAFVLMHAVAKRTFSPAELPLMLGVLQAMRGAGTLVGPFTTTVLGARGLPITRALVVADVLVVVGLFAMLMPDALALGVASLVVGIGHGTNWMISTTVIQRDAPLGVQGRLAALDELAWTAIYAATAFAVGAAVDAGVPHVHIACVAAVLGLGASAALGAMSPTLDTTSATPTGV